MRSQASTIMLSFLLSYAQIRAEVIPQGIMPKDKRQVVATGATPTTTDPAPVESEDTVTTDPSTTPDPDTSDDPTTTEDSDPSTTMDDPTTEEPQTQDPTTEQPTTEDPESEDDEPPTADADTTTAEETTAEETTEPPEGSSPSPEPTSTPTTVAVTTTDADGARVTSEISSDTLAPATNSAVSTDTSNTDLVRLGSSTINRSTLSKPTTVTTALVDEFTSSSIYTTFYTSDGQVYSSLVTENAVFSSTTGFATATIDPSLANGGGDGSNLSDNAKSIIGGVVGGIGGAVLIGGLAFVAWRLWGKKKAEKHGEVAEVWNGRSSGSRPDSIETAKRSSGMGTLSEGGYSNPGGRINASSNF